MGRARLVCDRLTPEAERRLLAAYNSDTPMRVLARRFDISPCWIRTTLDRLQAAQPAPLQLAARSQ